MISGYRTVGIIFGVENKNGIGAIKLVHCGLIKAFNRGFLFALQGVVNHKKIKQQHGKGIQIRLGTWPNFSPDHLRCHKTRGAQHAADILPINGHIIVVADQYLPGLWIEENISK